MYKCLICDKEYEKRRCLSGHLTSHSREDKDLAYPKIKADFNILFSEPKKCKYCSKLLKSKNSLKQHEIRCSKNLNRKINLSFEHYNRDFRNTIGTFKCRFCLSEFKSSVVLGGHAATCLKNPNYDKNYLILKNLKSFKGRTHTAESRKLLSDIAQNGVKNGTWHMGNSWLGVTEYISQIAGKVFLMGGWEIEYAKYLDSNNIKWIHNHKRFEYESDQIPSGRGWYKPDFYLIDEDCYIEIKGYEKKLDSDKWKCFPNKLKILRYKDLVSLGLKIK